MSDKKPSKRKVVIFPYDHNWPKLFTAEKAKILAVVNDKTVRVEHIVERCGI